MYYQYFGLDRPPFKITPDTDFFFGGGNRGAVLEALVYAVTHGEGIVKVTGEVGSGKTMLCRMLQSRLPPEIEQVYIANPSVSPEEILYAIAFELGLNPRREATRIELMHALHDHLVKRHAEGRQVVIFVEESQSMPVATLEEIRLLSNLETQHHKLLQIVLFGQPELDEILTQPNIRQLRERIAHSFSLQPLRAEEIREYLMFRLRAAGYRGPDLFSPKLVRYVADATGGLSRRVNLVADKALLAAFAGNTHTVTLAHVQAAVRESEFSPKGPQGVRWMSAAALVATGAAVGAAAFWWLGGPRTVPGSPSVDYRATGSATGAPTPAAGSPAVDASPGAAPPPLPSSAPTSSAPVRPAASATSASASDTTRGRASSPEPTDDVFSARLAATKDWMERSANRGFTIQLTLAADEPEEVKRYLNHVGKFIEADQVYVYRTRIQDKPYVAVVYGDFPSRQAAHSALQKLPHEVKADRPYVRSRVNVRDEALKRQQPA